MSEERFRNHPTTIIQNLVLVFFFGLFTLNSIILSDFLLGGIVLLVILGIGLIFTVIYWAKRTIIIGKEEAIVESNIFYKRKKNIPYSKIASVNITRGIFNRIFGTTTLSININTSNNPRKPEARFIFDIDLAEKLKRELTSGVFHREEEAFDEENHESVIKFTTWDVVLHSIFGMPTYQVCIGFLMIVYSILSALFLEGSGVFFALLIFFITQPITVILSILKYLNFKIYRVGDQIHVQYGALQKFTSKFEVNRINAIRIRRPLFARMMGKSCLEAEVVGINTDSKEATPLLCLMSGRNNIEKMIHDLVPEFIYEAEMIEQPSRAKFPLLMKATFGSLITAALLAYPSYWMYINGVSELGAVSPVEIAISKYSILAIMLLAIGILYFGAYRSYKIKKIAKGEELFTFIFGLVDRQIVTIQYDRVQIFKVSAGPLPRRLGLARGSISLLSSMGTKKMISGYFPKEELSEIGDTMMDRLKDGNFDYKKNSI